MKQNLPLFYFFGEDQSDNNLAKTETCRRHTVKWQMIVLLTMQLLESIL